MVDCPFLAENSLIDVLGKQSLFKSNNLSLSFFLAIWTQSVPGHYFGREHHFEGHGRPVS